MSSYARNTIVQPGTYTYFVKAAAGPKLIEQKATITVVAQRTLTEVINTVRDYLRPHFSRDFSITILDFHLDPA